MVIEIENDDGNSGFGAGIFSPVANGKELSACDFDLPMSKYPRSSKRPYDASYNQSGSPSSAGMVGAAGQGPKLQKPKLGSAAASAAAASTTKRTNTFEHTSPSFALDPDNYEIILLVDTSEHRGGRDKNQIQQKLQVSEGPKAQRGRVWWWWRCVCVCGGVVCVVCGVGVGVGVRGLHSAPPTALPPCRPLQ